MVIKKMKGSLYFIHPIKIAIIVSRFNYFINKNLINGALDTLLRVGNLKEEDIYIVEVPGAYEIPLIAKILSKSRKYRSIITIATLIKGDTKHFEFISNTCISEISKISIKYEIPISCGILTTENLDQAIIRSGSKMGNKGSEAALVSLEMINLIDKISKTSLKKEKY
ncbi:6,7-dimethyl-8-ribityllumazine synthase [Candidatus Riesia pediculicola]|uniref:6,7-dimethyl-8-ribityllumazine synthase n=1 Tax=Candidatus Riesia pediculicola TaxID=401619 RepID=UPI0009E2A062|nr:6,7-dimethyl-8-ribityllumazine synthase [Candidatus Riesia pediculicola]